MRPTLLQSFAPPHDPNERLYRMSKICLETAAADRETIPAVIVYFEIWLLKLGGFLPSWAQCAECGREPGQTETVSLEADFNIVCGRCSARGRVSDVSSELRRAYEGAQRTGPVRFTEDIREKDEITRELSSILRRMIARILNREVKGSEGAA